MSYASIPTQSIVGYQGFGVDPGAITTGKYCGSASNIQQALNDLGYGPLAVDGQLGQASFKAMDKFYGSSVGYASPAFCSKLQAALAAAQAPPPDPGSASPPPVVGTTLPGAPPAAGPPPATPASGGAASWWDSQTQTMKYTIIGSGVLTAALVALLVVSGSKAQVAHVLRLDSWVSAPGVRRRSCDSVSSTTDLAIDPANLCARCADLAIGRGWRVRAYRDRNRGVWHVYWEDRDGSRGALLMFGTATARPESIHDRVLAKLRAMSAEDIAKLSVKAGVHTTDGKLTPEYGGKGEP